MDRVLDAVAFLQEQDKAFLKVLKRELEKYCFSSSSEMSIIKDQGEDMPQHTSPTLTDLSA